MADSGKVLVLGSGPTGLAAAVRLARGGIKVKVIERLPWTGGLCKTFTHGPYALDLGPHRFTPHNQEVFDFVNEYNLGLDVVEYKAEILVGHDTFVRYPFQLGNLIRKMPPSLSTELVVPYLMATLKPKPEARTYEEWVMDRFGRGVTERILRPLVEKVWGTPLSGLAARFASQRIANASLLEIAWEVLTHHRPARYHSAFYPDNGFLYPRLGFGTIVDAMAKEITERGGEIATGASVEGITTSGGRVTSVEYVQNDQRVREDNPAFVISTLPIQHFFKIAQPSPNAEILETAQSLKTRRLVILYLVINRDRFSENTSMYFPASDIPFGRIWEQKNHGPATIPVPGKTVVGVEMPCWQTDALWTDSEAVLFEKAIVAFEKLGLLKRSEVEEYFAVRLGWVYPVWDLAYEKRMQQLLSYERGIENLIFNGRPGLYFYNNLHHSLEMGLVSANHVLSGQTKADRWNKDSDEFASFHLVE